MRDIGEERRQSLKRLLRQDVALRVTSRVVEFADSKK
jgi:hypothetical protein